MQLCTRRLLCASRPAWRARLLSGTVGGDLRYRQLTTSSSSQPAHASAPTPAPSPPPPSPPASAPPPPNSALLLFCLSTGLVDSLTFAVSGVWCAFVTGTTVQLGMDLPSLFAELGALNAVTSFPTAVSYVTNSSTAERAAALGGFIFGGFVGSRLPRWVTPARSSALQSALLAGAGALALMDPAATYMPHPLLTLGMISTSMSLQAVLVQSLKTPFATSVAWTSVWLSAVSPSSHTARWKRFAGLAALMGGAGIGAFVVHFGKEEGAGNERSDESRRTTLHRMGWGLVGAAAIKTTVGVIFWRRGRGGRMQL
ncbi:uncharacterized protein C8Q71DRAFT_905203 [Rhodofomes roseus]|uniref:Membrane transporter protein n=1 Tax=Rhodofomes roseus TaxID=34475 RepID=A0ABQ8KNB9_9APHY|nr:uncharacterized protein C8Q71DRAFT_905203 [Rhodofomes roseus]KAH9839806.1 hypothetical protein C8Q71DRAFT_905203 [Rhodofomes roseus]